MEQQVKDTFKDHKNRYGARRIMRELSESGVKKTGLGLRYNLYTAQRQSMVLSGCGHGFGFPKDYWLAAQ